MKIDLRNYARELGHWLEAFEPFMDRASRPELRRLSKSLEDGRDAPHSSFPWRLHKPLRSVEADKYDGLEKTPHKVWIGWQFEADFERGPDLTKKYIWTIRSMVTQIRVHSSADDSEILHFHYDLKNLNANKVPQLGPHIHMQFSEHYLKEHKRIAIAVPRFPSAVLLPTDCFDLVLSEFFPSKWPKEQSKLTGIDVLRAGQRQRMVNMAEALNKVWEVSRKRTLVAAIQNCYMPDIQIA